jgi:hypothetical protein
LQISIVTQRRFAWIAAAIAIAAYYPRYRHGDGAVVFSAAADCLLARQTPQHCGDLIYAYSPFFALLWVPLAPAAMWLREAIWYLALIGTLFASLRMGETLVRRLFPGAWSERELALLRTLTFVLSLKFILAVLENQAYDSIAVAFILLGLTAAANERWLWAAASLATAAALKVTPVIFLPYLLFKRHFAAAAVFLAVLIVLSLLPDLLLPSKGQSYAAVWIRDVLLSPFSFDPRSETMMRFWITDSPMNQSFRAAIVRLFTGVKAEQPFVLLLAIMQSRAFAIALYGVMAIYIITVSLAMLKSRRDDRLITVDGGLLIVSALLLTPVSSQSHFVGLMLPYALVAAALIRIPSARLFNAAMLLMSFVLATATSNDAAGKALTHWALWSSLPVYGTLILVVPLAVLIWNVRARTAEPGADGMCGDITNTEAIIRP